MLFTAADSNTNISLKDSQFRHFRLSNVRFKRTELNGSDFSDVVMRGGQFVRSVLNNADFSRASLHDVTFDTVQAGSVNFKQAGLLSVLFICREQEAGCALDIDPDEIQALEAAIPFSDIGSYTEVPVTSWEGIASPLIAVDFYDASIANSTFSINPHIAFAKFLRARVLGTSLDRQKLYLSSLYKAAFFHSHFRGAVLHNINARDAAFVDVNFADAQITKVDLSGALLSDVDFSGSRLTNVIIDHDNLDAINGAQLSGRLLVVGNFSQVYDGLDQLSGVCAMEDFVGFVPVKAEEIVDYYEKDPERRRLWLRMM